MIECERIAAGIERNGERFLNRFFTAGERADCADKPYRLAARFAAKEAVAKALGTGIGDIRWVDVEIRTDGERRKPLLSLHGQAKELAAQLLLTEWDISLATVIRWRLRLRSPNQPASPPQRSSNKRISFNAICRFSRVFADERSTSQISLIRAKR